MTIRFLRQWNGYDDQEIVTLSGVEESRLIGLGIAVDATSVANKQFSNPVYNGDGTLSTATINGTAYTFTYSSGKIATVTGGGVTKTYTWSGDQLVSVVVA